MAMVGEPLNIGGERKMEPDNPGSIIKNFTTGHGNPSYGINQESQKLGLQCTLQSRLYTRYFDS